MFSKGKITIIASIFLTIMVVFFSTLNSSKLSDLEDEYLLQKAKTKTMRMHVNKLKTEFINFNRNDAYVEKYLRENLGFGKEKELVYVFND